jgi:YHS domain-containing protein
MKNSLLVLFFLTALLPFKSSAQIDPIDKNGIALDGYDVVTYFSGKAVKGSKQNNTSYNGAIYYFQSKENQKTFEADPTKYLPQYEGYCALGVSYGKKISVDPNTFRITNGKLYLFYNGDASGKKVNSLETWNKNENRLLKKADALWPDVKKRKYRKDDVL